MKAIQRLTPPLLLLAAACSPASNDGGGGEAPGTSAAGGTETAQGGSAWSAETLDTGVDLSHLRKEGSQGAGFPSTSATPASAADTPVALPASTPPGRIELAEEGMESSHAFGDILEGDSMTHLFQLRAAGENPLIIQRLKPSCGCTAAQVDLIAADGTRSTYVWGDPIQPGTLLEVPTTVNSAGRSGKMRTNVNIYSNDPASPFRLDVEADVVPVLVVEPMLLDFGKITSNERKEGRITVRSDVLDPFFLTLDQAQVLAPLEVELVPESPDASGKSTTWTLEVALGPGTPEGIRRYPLKLITDVAAPHDDGHGHGPAPATETFRTTQANIQATVSGMIVANPNFVSLGLVAPGTPVERSVRIESLDPAFALSEDMPIEVVSFTGDEFQHADQFSFDVSPVAGQEGQAVDLTITLAGMPEDFQGSFGGSVRMKIGHPSKDLLEIRFSGVSRPGLPAQPAGGGTGAGGQ